MSIQTSYFYQALQNIVNAKPPEFMKEVTVKGYHDLTDEKANQLQDWVVENHSLTWATGMGVIEAAILIVKEAVAEGSINEVPPGDAIEW